MATREPSFSLSAEASWLEDGAPAIALKIQSDVCELNLWLAVSSLPRLREVPSTPWEAGALRLGTSAGSSAFWSCDDGEIFVGVGHDDETWDFGVSFPETLFPDLIAEIERALGQSF